MGDVINLNRYRKDKRAAERERRANEKRARFGIPKNERNKSAAERIPVARLIARIDATRGAGGLSSAVRVWVLQHYREAARRGGRA